MVQEMMTPYHHNSKIQVYTQGSMYQQCFTPSQGSFQSISPCVLSLNTQNIMPPQMNLSNSAIPAVGLGWTKFYNQGLTNQSVSNGNFSKMTINTYRCNFLEQLKGKYEVDKAKNEQIHVVVAGQGDQQHCIVQEVFPNASDKMYQFIHDEGSRFTLRTDQGIAKAVMLKGMNMNHSLTWWTNHGTRVVWRRMGEVGFNTFSSSRRNCIVSECLKSVMNSNVDEVPTEAGIGIRPEIQLDRKCYKRSNLPEDTNTSLSGLSSQKEKFLLNDEMLSLFQKHLREHPSLLRRFLS